MDSNILKTYILLVLIMIMDFKTPNKYEMESLVRAKLVTERSDTNYTKYKYNKNINSEDWTPLLRMARGIVYRGGKIKALPLPKFFNINEVPETMFKHITEEFKPYFDTYIVSEKLDGVSIIAFWDEGWNLSTLGSLDNEYVDLAYTLFEELDYGIKLNNLSYALGLDKSEMTFQFELIHPEARIVVNYGDTKRLALFAIIHNPEERIIVDHLTMQTARKHYIDTVKSYPAWSKDVIDILWEKKLNEKPKDEEGFVIHHLDTMSKGWKRSFKVKYDFYMRRAYLKNHLSARNLLKIYVTQAEDFEKVYLNDHLDHLSEEDIEYIGKTILKFDGEVSTILALAESTLQKKEVIYDENAIRASIGRDDDIRGFIKSAIFDILGDRDPVDGIQKYVLKNLSKYNIA